MCKTIECSLNADAFYYVHSVESTESQKKQIKSSSKMLPPVGIEPRASDFNVLYATV